MTHLVLGYPSFEANAQVIAGMAEAGVELIELQIPFSEPVADGPVIARACQEAIRRGATVDCCMDFAAEAVQAHPEIGFLLMTYYNIVFRRGEVRFLEQSKGIGVEGFILPDLPPEEGGDFLAWAKAEGLAPVQIFAPTSTDERMAELAAASGGFVYVVARRGVTGDQTSFDDAFGAYLGRCRKATDLPLAVGFGIRSREDVASLRGRAEIAVVGTATIEVVDERGPAAAGDFVRSLR